MGKLIGIAVGVIVISVIVCVLMVFPVYRDIDATISRAQLSADAERMVNYLDQVITNMEKRGITQGSAAMVFKTPLNDIGLNHQALKDLKERAELISKMEKDSVEYQTGLDDLRGTLREINVDAGYYALWHNFFFWLAIATFIIAIIVAIILCII